MNHNQYPVESNRGELDDDVQMEQPIQVLLDREQLIRLLGPHYDPDADPAVMEELGRSVQLEIESYKSNGNGSQTET